MTKTQKILLVVFLAMFLVPEVLWSPVGNFVYEFTQSGYSGGTHPFRQTFLEDSDNINYLSTVLLIQFLGIFATFIYLIATNKSIKNKIVLWLSLIVCFVLSLMVFLFFGLSISLRHIAI